MSDDQKTIADLQRRCRAAEAEVARLKNAQSGLAQSTSSEALQESEDTLRGVFDTLQSGLILVNPAGVIVYANRRMAEMFDRPLAQLVGARYVDLTHGSVSDEAQANMERLMRGDVEHVLVDRIYRRGEHGTFVGELSGSRLHHADGSLRGLVGIITDITERKQTADALRESEERFRLLLNDIVAVSVQGYGPDGTTQYWNAGSEKLYGYTAEEALGRNLLDLIIPEEMREEVARAVRAMATTGIPVRPAELRLMRKDGSRVPVYSCHSVIRRAGHPPELFCVDVDLSAVKQAEAERERLIAAIEQSGEVIVITDPDGAIQYVNPAFEAITGYTRAEVLGQNPRVLKSGEHDEEFYATLWQTITAGRTWKGRFVNQRKDGRCYTEDATISPVRGGDGTIVNYVAVKRDITEHLQLAAQYQQAQKMESVGRLAGGVAHDFNNMLTAILGHAEMVAERLPPGEALRSDLDEIRRAAQRSADLTRQLLAFARRQTVAPEVLQLNSTVDAMLRMLRRLIGENIDLIWKPGENVPLVRVDPAQIDQLLVNLAVNARDAIEGVGHVVIETGQVVVDGGASDIGLDLRPGQYVTLVVSDDGQGMDEATRAQVFEPFFTTKGPGKGTGLGLATVYGIVKQNHGAIDVCSEPGQGCTFRIYLPAHTGEEAPDPDRRPDEPQTVRGHETILLVEDEPAILALGTKMLERQGYRVLPASTPGEAIRLAREYTGEVHLLVTDVVMPEMNGRELASELLAYLPGIKQLFMSGYTADVVADGGVLEEGINFVSKPISMQLLAAKVREALDA